jgi:hypothetical protein
MDKLKPARGLLMAYLIAAVFWLVIIGAIALWQTY